MQDEWSTSMRIAVTVWMTGALLGIVTGILVMSLSIMNSYTNKYSDTIAFTAGSSIADAMKEESQAGAIIYSRLENSIDSIDIVRVKPLSGSPYLIYKYNDVNCQNTISLMTTNKNKKYKITVTNGELVSILKTVTLTEVN